MPLPMWQQPPDVDSSLHPWCSGHPDAGTGGRANQLERIGALLGAPAWTSQPKGSTSLDLDVPVNPLAPEPLCKGCGSCAKKPPLPYSTSEPVDLPAITSTNVQGKKVKGTKAAVIPSSSMEVSDIQPSFYQCEAGTRFGFSQHIIPLGTEPDLQVLNNPYVAESREKVATTYLPIPIGISAVIGHLPATTTTSTKKNIMLRYLQAPYQLHINLILHSIKIWTLSFNQQTHLAKVVIEALLMTKKIRKLVEEHYRDTILHTLEVTPSQPQVTTALPLDFKFQYSHNEDNSIAERSLAVEDGASSDDDAVIQPVVIEPESDDVLLCHQKKNGYPHIPNSEFLNLLQCSDTKLIKVEESGTKATMAKVPKSRQPPKPKPTQLGWYPPCWKAFFEDAKGDCHTQHAIENTFLTLADDLPISITKALISSLVEWLKGSKQVKPGLWPDYKSDMAKLLYKDLSTWHSNLKTIAVAIVPTMYNLIPSPEVPMQDHITWVQNATKELLDDLLYLCNSVDTLEKTNNAAHPALWEAIISFLYTGSYCVACRRLEIFRKEVPLNSLAFICTVFHCVLDGFIKNGNGKSFPKFSTKEYSSIYQSMIPLLQGVKNDC
ncbi:hypothetical protein BDR07DRAFT_1487298 [Suillus spraguei]|nr:hypothetical protein BDR07DRAFT_1487298 [Suillus spraguei]